MPELPEVETIRRDLEKAVVDRTITAVDFDAPKMLKPSAEVVASALTGARITKFDRVAKLLLIETDSVTAAIHLKLSGQLLLKSQTDPPDRFAHVIFKLDNGQEIRF